LQLKRECKKLEEERQFVAAVTLLTHTLHAGVSFQHTTVVLVYTTHVLHNVVDQRLEAAKLQLQQPGQHARRLGCQKVRLKMQNSLNKKRKVEPVSDDAPSANWSIRTRKSCNRAASWHRSSGKSSEFFTIGLSSRRNSGKSLSAAPRNLNVHKS
jgi:hypothetical protein